ncbi:MAG TPA: FAD-dependent oxidoreductase [Stellaceae bacterium]|nr:FAD-dependent oxidoreductase [Stellaceae bacterium]
MSDEFVDMCVIGAGAAGLTTAAIAGQLGARTVLIERAEMGGECLNTGCVPSKALLAAARAAHAVRTARRFGVNGAAPDPDVDFAAVRRHVRGVVDAIAPHDSVERFEGLGVDVVSAEARFVGPSEIAAGNHTIRARRIVIATGSEPAIPPIPGIGSVPYFTNETIFDNDRLPDHLVIIGAGAVGIELAQAHRRLGAAVTIVEVARAMPRDDPELAGMLLRGLADEGIDIREQADIKSAEPTRTGVALNVETNGQRIRIEGSHLLIAAGRKPRTDRLDLERAGIKYDKRGITVDRRLRTTARGVFAIGDVIDAPHLTHVAGYHAGIVIRNALFRLPAKVDYAALPWVTYTDPELAQVGSTEAEARRRYGEGVRVIRLPLAENDRAQAERHTAGIVKIVAHRNGQVLGASILAPHAGELAHVWVLAIEQRLKLRHIASMLAPYPTWGEANKMAAAEFYKPRLFGVWTRRAVRTLSWLP